MITCIILFHNETDTIRKCIDSVLWCDEVMIINDLSSAHARKQIPDRKNVHVFTRALAGDFSAQRNFGLEKAKGEWVLFVDADEVVPTVLKKEIIHITSPQPLRSEPNDSGSKTSPAPPSQKLRRSGRRGSEITGYALKRRDYFLGRWLRYGETSSVRLVRLAKKDAGVWKGNVHETWNIHGPVGELETSLSHYPHKTIAEFLESINTYSTLVAKHLTPALSSQERGNLRVITHPVGKFFHNYILRLGFLDGVSGLIMAMMMSFHSFLVRAKRWEKE